MNTQWPRLAVLSLTVAGVISAAASCDDDRATFDASRQQFGTDAAGDVAQPCGFQCSLDGRSVENACTGEIVQTCPDNQACGAATCQEPCAAAAAEHSSNGCEFYVQMPRYTNLYSQDCLATFVVNTSTQPLTLGIEYQGKALDLSKAVFQTSPGSAALTMLTGPLPPGESAVVFVSDRDPTIPHAREEFDDVYIACPAAAVPAYVGEITTDGTTYGSSFHLTTNTPAGMSAIYPYGGAASAFPTAMLLFPVATWAQSHVLVNGWGMNTNAGTVEFYPGVQIVASEDETDVTLLPTHDIQDGYNVKGSPANVPVTYRIGKGQFLEITQAEELTGTLVSSTKPITTFGGHAIADIPASGGAADILQQQIPAFEQWGSEYVGVGYRPRVGDEHELMPYRIVAARDGTLLEYDPVVPPGAPTTLAAGQEATFASGVGDAFVVRTQDADHPIYVSAHMTGASEGYLGGTGYDNHGDPEFVNVIPTGQYLSSYSFYADPTYADTSLVIVRAKNHGAFEDVTLDCAGVLTGWKPIGSDDFEWMRVDLAIARGPGTTFGSQTCQNGLHRMTSKGPFTATIWGWDSYASYAYPGGVAQRKLVLSPLGPLR